MSLLEYYKSMEFYSYIKNLGIPVLNKEGIISLYGHQFSDIDFVIKTPTQFLMIKMAFKVPHVDLITEDETQKLVDTTKSLSVMFDAKCSGYFIGNVKMADKAYDIFKRIKQQSTGQLYFAFCCDSDQNKLNAKIIKMLYSNQLYIYDVDGDCVMIDN